MKLRWGWVGVLSLLAGCSTEVCARGGSAVCTFGGYDEGFDSAVALDAGATDAGSPSDAASDALNLGIDGGDAEAGRK